MTPNREVHQGLHWIVDKGRPVETAPVVEILITVRTYSRLFPGELAVRGREYRPRIRIIQSPERIEQRIVVKLIAEQIQELGAEHCIIATDFGVYTLPEPVEGLREFIACLLDLGMSNEDIMRLVKDNPEKLLGLS